MQKKIIFLSVLFFLSPVLLSPVLVTNAQAVYSNSSSGSSSNSSSSHEIVKWAYAVESVNGKTLILQNKKQYSLAGVKVLDLTKERRNKAKLINVKVAEMTFVDGRLTEVVIRLH